MWTRAGWLQAGQLRVSLERAVSQQTGWEFSGPQGWSSWWTPLPLRHTTHSRLAPRVCSARQEGWEGEHSGTQFRSCTPHLLTGPQLKLRHVAASACWEGVLFTVGSHVPVVSWQSHSMRDGQSIVPGLFLASPGAQTPSTALGEQGVLLCKGEGTFPRGLGGL